MDFKKIDFKEMDLKIIDFKDMFFQKNNPNGFKGKNSNGF